MCGELSLDMYVGECYLQLKHHVEHALGTVGFQQLDYVRMLQHVTYCGFAFQICNDTQLVHIRMGNICMAVPRG